MSKEENVLKYYSTCCILKDTIREGWINWNVKKERIESVAEHVFGVMMLAIAINSEYKYDIDMNKVLMMLAIHEIGEAIIGDKTMFQISKEEKERIEREAVHNILDNLVNSHELEELFLEFDEKKTKEAKFAYMCDKLECDLQSKIYDEGNYVDIYDQENNETRNNPLVNKLFNEGNSFSSMWIKFGQEIYPYDDNFRAIGNYANQHGVNSLKLKKKEN